MCWRYNIVLLLILKSCVGVIHHLNDSEYDKMPELYGLDDYYPCLRNNGTYYVVKFDLVAEPNNQLMDTIRDYSNFQQIHFNYSYINRGMCLNDTCKEYKEAEEVGGDVSAALERCVQARELGTRGLGTRLAYVHSCETSAALCARERTIADWLFATVALLIIAFNLFATAYDYFLPKNRQKNTIGNPVILSFSIFKNWKWLVTPGAEHETLRGFHGIKAVCSFFVVLPHVFILFVQFIDNPRYLEMTYRVKPFYILYNGLTMVQIFFVISGFLLVYNLEQKFGNRNVSWTLLPKLIFYRWWRLTPAYAFVIAFTSTWLRHLGSGPMWQSQVVDLPIANCRQHWWKHLLYIQNYEPRDTFCNLPSWHIAADVQLFILGSVVYIATKSRGRNIVLALLLIVGIFIPAFEVWRMNIHPVVVVNPETFRQYRNDVFYYFHIRGHNNLPCFVIGMFCGRLVRSWKISNSGFAKNKIAKFWTWCVVPAILLVFMSGQVFYESPELQPIWFRMAYAASLRVVIGVIVGFGIVGLTLRVDTRMTRFWKWRGWLVPGRLSFGVFLVHMNIIHYILGTRNYLMHISPLNLVVYLLSVFLVSLVLALPLHLLVESPMNQLLHVITSATIHKYKKR